MVGIYKITSPEGRIYIGKTRNWERRKSTYRSVTCSRQPELYASLCKFGWFNHSFEMIYSLPEDIADEVLDCYEQFCVDQFKSNIHKYPLDNGMNSTDGGATHCVKLYSTEANKSRSQALKGVAKTKAHAAKISDSLKGRSLSKEHIENMRLVPKKTKPIEQHSLEGVFIKEWPGLKIAANALGIERSGRISGCARGVIKTAYGFIWKFKK